MIEGQNRSVSGDLVDRCIFHLFSTRFATYDVQNNTQYRTLIKAFGIRFVILVDAKVYFTLYVRIKADRRHT